MFTISAFKRFVPAILVLGSAVFTGCGQASSPAIVFQTDFGLRDGAVSEMKGVCMEIDPRLRLFDLTHEIPPFDVWTAACRLNQSAPYWPAGTVFVSVVDPGVGTRRKSVVLRTGNGHYFVSPDNGTLGLVSKQFGIESIREIDETRNRRPGSEGSNTFHGRDVYAYTAALLASGRITFEEVGPELPRSVVDIDFPVAGNTGGVLSGGIPVLDVQFGNVWTNISDSLFGAWAAGKPGPFRVTIYQGDSLCYTQILPFVKTFGDVPLNRPLLYVNSLMNLSLALNQGNFAETFHIQSGPAWKIKLETTSED